MAPKRKRVAADPRKAIAYIRVSTEEQKLGPEAQREDIERWAAANVVTILAWHYDVGKSGSHDIDKRPGLLEAVAGLAANGAGHLIIAKLDRLARDVLVMAAVQRLVESEGAVVTCADGSGNGSGPTEVFLRNILGSFAQFERAQIRLRTTRAMAVARAKGRFLGNAPYGYHKNEAGGIEPDEAELRTLARVRELNDGSRSLRQIAAALTAEGHQARDQVAKGGLRIQGRWHASSVNRLLKAISVPTTDR